MKKSQLVLWVIWFALFSAVFIYAVVALNVVGPAESSDETSTLPSEGFSSQTLLFGALAFGGFASCLLAAGFFRRRWEARRVNETIVWGPDILAGAIVVWALAESIAILGLVALLVGVPPALGAVCFGVGSALLMVLNPAFLFPKGIGWPDELEPAA
ncbi:MAG: hypothetical protein ACFCU3_10285 [Verrucomicrobiales bacterium]